MPKFVGFHNYEENEMEKMNQMAEQDELTKQTVESAGGELLHLRYTIGEHDVVFVAEFPNDEAAAEAAFAYSKEFGGEIELVPAFTGEEFDEVVEHLDETPA